MLLLEPCFVWKVLHLFTAYFTEIFEQGKWLLLSKNHWFSSAWPFSLHFPCVHPLNSSRYGIGPLIPCSVVSWLARIPFFPIGIGQLNETWPWLKVKFDWDSAEVLSVGRDYVVCMRRSDFNVGVYCPWKPPTIGHIILPKT